MFSSLSHELRTPLNCSIAMMQILKDQTQDHQLTSQYLIPALHSNKLLLNLVNDILDYV